MGQDYEDMAVPYQKKDKTKPYREIVLDAIEKCRLEGSKEMKKGFEKKVFMAGQWTTVQVPDQRETYIQCVKQLEDLMFYVEDGKMQSKSAKIKDKIKSSYATYIAKYIIQEPLKRNKDLALKHKTIPASAESSLGERINQEWKNHIVNLYRKLYRQLLLLFKRKNELSKVKMMGAYE